MSTRLIGRRNGQENIGPGLDRVVAAYPLPIGGTLNSVHLQMDLMAAAGEALSVSKMVIYGVSAYVVPVADPDANLSFDGAWDSLVPKDEQHGQELDLDTVGSDTTAEFELGEIDLANLFDMVGLAPRQIFRRRKFLSVAQGTFIGGTAVDTWFAADYFATQIKRPVRVSMPSYILVGVSSPDLTRTGAIWTGPNEDEWAMLQYLDLFIEQMFMASLGLIEAGAETPYEEAETFISELLEDTVYEATADAFHPTTWTAFCKSTFDITVPGRPQLKVLSSEG